ncbi:DUF3459 domain-containing protein, partial [Streptomyces sp. NPDC059900]
LGLPEADIPRERIQDPMHARSGEVDPGRDGCRVPLPWDGAPERSWLPVPPDWAGYAAERQAHDPDSMLSLYRTALRLRRSLGDAGPLRRLRADEPHVLAFARTSERDGTTWLCLANFGPHDVVLPAGTELLLASGPLSPRGQLPQDTAVWLRV